MTKKTDEKNNNITYLVIIPIILLVFFAYYVINKNNKFYLEDKYYNSGEYIPVKSEDINLLNNDNYILYTYNNFCSLPVHCEDVFKEMMQKNKIDFLSISYEEFKKTKYHNTVEYAPSIIIIKNGKIVAYLDAESDIDLEKYQDSNKFEEWISKYIYLTK